MVHGGAWSLGDKAHGDNGQVHGLSKGGLTAWVSGHKVEVTTNMTVWDALKQLSAGARPDVILLDVMMPQMDGPGVLSALRRMEGLGETPVIFMTARAQSGEIDRFKTLGAIGVITKPFDPMTLASQVRDLLAEARA